MAPAKKQQKGAPPSTAQGGDAVKRRKGGHHNREANAARHRDLQAAIRAQLQPVAADVPKRKNGKPAIAPSAARPKVYNEEIAHAICLRFASDTKMTLGHLDADPLMPTSFTFCEWLRDTPTLARLYARSRDIQFEKQAEELEDIARNPLIGEIRIKRTGTDAKGQPFDSEEIKFHDNVERARLIVDTRKWILSKQRPKKYGVQVAADAGAPNEQLKALFDALRTEG